MNNDLISRSALKQYVNDHSTHWLDEWDTAGVILTIEKAPAVDAVPVVRCKDCKHWSVDCGTDETVCLKIYSDGAASAYAWQERKPDDFCSYGKRRGDDATD